MAKVGGFEFWTKVLQRAKYVVAPMVDQSELAWRLLSRKYGAHLCYTPMFHAANFRRDPNYRRDNFTTCENDRPLIVQFCANCPETLLEAAKHVAPYCDGVDINLGCPQAIAKKGHYGAFLQDEWDLLTSMIRLLNKELSVPVTCKIRVFEDVEKTVRYAKMLEGAGCQLLTVHGRTREQRGEQTGLASWEHIKAVKRSVNIPVFANGNIQFLEDVERCLDETVVEGVMSAEGHLFNPALFTGRQPPCWTLIEEYLELVRQYPCSTSTIRGHFFKLWIHVMKEPEYLCFREKVGNAKTLEAFESIAAELKHLLLERLSEDELSAEFERDSIPFWRCQPYERPNRGVVRASSNMTTEEERSSGVAKKMANEARMKRKKREAENRVTQGVPKKKRWFACENCTGNPKGMKCVHNMCKICCRLKCIADVVGCAGHRFTPRPIVSSVHPEAVA